MDANQILKDIKYKIGQREIFKHKREHLIICLITAVNDMTFYSMKMMELDFASNVIEQFRAILKFIYENSTNDMKKVDDIDDMIHQFDRLIQDFVTNYTPVRNYLEQCILGTRKLNYNEKTNTYIEDSFDKDLYFSRIRDRLTEGNSSSIKDSAAKSIISYCNHNRKPINYRDRFFKTLMDDYINACWCDSEIKFEYDFDDFKYSELISFCAALLLIGSCCQIHQYDFGYLTTQDMIQCLTSLTELSVERIIFFLNHVTYNYEYQKNKLTLIQYLIKEGDAYYFCAYNLILGMLPMKTSRAIFDMNYEKYEKKISGVAKLKEKQMTSEILELLKKYDLNVITEYRLKNPKTNMIDAEYDILIYDNKTAILYIAECKWFYRGDGEEEHNKIDNKIKKAINDRLIKNKFILDNQKEFVSTVFEKEEVKDVREMLISQNFMGLKRHSMRVIDFETLKDAVEKNDSFNEAMEYIYSEKYRDTIDYRGELFDAHIEGYNFSIYRLLGKKKKM